MQTHDIVTALIAIAAAALPLATARNARTAPALHSIAVIAAMAVATWIFLLGGYSSQGVLPIACAAVIAISALVVASIMALHEPIETLDAGSASHNAVIRACRIHDDAHGEVTRCEGERKRMSIMERLIDSFVTTDDEERCRQARWTRQGTKVALSALVPDLHTKRTDELLDTDADAKRRTTDLKQELEPLEIIETAARDLHAIGVQAVRALDRAISDLETASTYEKMDLVTSNNGIAIMSSMQNSSASSAVQDASAAITRLSVAIREDISTNLRLAHDTMDLILDLGLDSAFDFMSIFALHKIGDAKKRCEAARERVMIIEQRLAQALHQETAKADVVRRKIAEVRAPFYAQALGELPPTAREHVTAAPMQAIAA